MKRVVVACFALTATALAAGALTRGAAGGDMRVEPTGWDVCGRCMWEAHADAQGTSGLVAARIRAGWECETRRRTEDGRRVIAWRCALGQPVTWSGL